MSYSLETVHGIIDNWLYEKKAVSATANNGEKCDSIQKAIIEVRRLPLQWMRQTAAAGTREAFRISLEITVAGCTDLINKLDRHREISMIAMSKDKAAIHALDELKEALVEFCVWLRQSFLSCFPNDQLLPVKAAEGEIEALQLKWQQIKAKLGSEAAPAGLIEILSAPVIQLTENPMACATYHRLAYLQNLFSDIESSAGGNGISGNALTNLTNLLIFYNFNHPGFIRYLIQEYVEGASGLCSTLDNLAYWNGLAKKMEQVPVSGLVLNTNLPSVKESLSGAVKAEIGDARAKEEILAAVYGSKTGNNTQPEKSSPVLTTLSVSQLGVWFRLLTDCSIIQHKNQTDLLKKVAGALQTTRAATISAESLRVKYYAPELVAMNIVKEQLLQMLNQLKKY